FQIPHQNITNQRATSRPGRAWCATTHTGESRMNKTGTGASVDAMKPDHAQAILNGQQPDQAARDLEAGTITTVTVNDVAPDPTLANGAAADWKASLAPDHARLIEDSAISPEVAIARGYWTARTQRELELLGFGSQQRIVPALVVPIRGVTGDIVNYQCRPDRPRARKSKNGKP